MDTALVRASKRLAYHLRHRPGELGLTLSPGGWVELNALLAALRRHGPELTPGQLEQLLDGPAPRFERSADGRCIRATHGHSTPAPVDHPPAEPPELLYHGTTATVVPQIRRDGLRPMRRQFVHLSPDVPTARRVGARRRGQPVVLTVDAAGMYARGAVFHRTPAGVWLTREVPPEALLDAATEAAPAKVR